MTLLQEIESAGRFVNTGATADFVGVANTGTMAQEFRNAGIGFTSMTVTYSGTGSTAFSGLNYTTTPIGITVGTTGDQTKSPDQLKYEKRKSRLIEIVQSMRHSAPNWSGLAMRIDPISAESAEAFIRCLPGKAVLPRVAPDGEGDVMFVWEKAGEQPCVVTVEKRSLHLACKLGSPQAERIDAQKFLGLTIPPAIAERIPSK